jgi:hypothetical protein
MCSDEETLDYNTAIIAKWQWEHYMELIRFTNDHKELYLEWKRKGMSKWVLK